MLPQVRMDFFPIKQHIHPFCFFRDGKNVPLLPLPASTHDCIIYHLTVIITANVGIRR